MPYETVIMEKGDTGVATLTLNRPDKLNAFNRQQRDEFESALRDLGADASVRALILTGAGRGFCTGADVSGMAERLSSEAPSTPGGGVPRLTGYLALMLHRLAKPTIAAVNGVCVGMGLSLALACDIRIAAESARFSAIFVKRGLMGDNGCTLLLHRAVGISRALEMLYTGDIIGAQEAERIGLVSRVVPDGELLKAARELGGRIAAGPPIAISLDKEAVYRSATGDVEDQLIFENFGQVACRDSEDHREGVRAFMEKREPVFKGR